MKMIDFFFRKKASDSDLPAELSEFENELKKLKPAESPYSPPAVYRIEKRTFSKVFAPLGTLCAGILIGAVLGAATVYFLLRSDSNDIIAIDAPAQSEENATGTPASESAERIPERITPFVARETVRKPTEPNPFDLDAMITQYVNRRKAAPQLSQLGSFPSRSTNLSQSLSDPNSLMQLRSSQNFNEI